MSARGLWLAVLHLSACSEAGVAAFVDDHRTGVQGDTDEVDGPTAPDPSQRIGTRPDYDGLFDACMVPDVRTLCPYVKSSDEQDPRCLDDVAALTAAAEDEVVRLAGTALADGSVSLDALVRAEVPLTLVVDHFVYPALPDTLGPQVLREIVVLLGDHRAAHATLRDDHFFRGWHQGRKVYVEGYTPAYAYTFDAPHLYCYTRYYLQEGSIEPASLYFTASVRDPALVGEVDPLGSNRGVERENLDGNVLAYRASNIDAEVSPRGSPHDLDAFFYRIEASTSTRSRSYAEDSERFILEPALDRLFDLTQDLASSTNGLLGLDEQAVGTDWDHRRRVIYYDGHDFYVVAQQLDGQDVAP
ncbi:MAG: hypothetical protein KC656_17870 [Myxococcales bacterium]|nr:hypothetical protein [Myxococcales bacterium]